MIAILAAVALAGEAVPSALPKGTDFGVREVAGARAPVQAPPGSAAPRSATTRSSAAVDLGSAASLGANWGRVTSTWRSVARNRAVGGARNSYHLHGRAIDIARHAGVRHSDIEAAYRRAGFTLVESLDEGDHSHFAFGPARTPRPFARPVATASTSETPWRLVSAPSSGSR